MYLDQNIVLKNLLSSNIRFVNWKFIQLMDLKTSFKFICKTCFIDSKVSVFQPKVIDIPELEWGISECVTSQDVVLITGQRIDFSKIRFTREKRMNSKQNWQIRWIIKFYSVMKKFKNFRIIITIIFFIYF